MWVGCSRCAIARQGQDIPLLGCQDRERNLCKHGLSDAQFIAHDAIAYGINGIIDKHEQNEMKNAELLLMFTLQPPPEDDDAPIPALEDDGSQLECQLCLPAAPPADTRPRRFFALIIIPIYRPKCQIVANTWWSAPDNPAHTSQNDAQLHLPFVVVIGSRPNIISDKFQAIDCETSDFFVKRIMDRMWFGLAGTVVASELTYTIPNRPSLAFMEVTAIGQQVTLYDSSRPGRIQRPKGPSKPPRMKRLTDAAFAARGGGASSGAASAARPKRRSKLSAEQRELLARRARVMRELRRRSDPGGAGHAALDDDNANVDLESDCDSSEESFWDEFEGLDDPDLADEILADMIGELPRQAAPPEKAPPHGGGGGGGDGGGGDDARREPGYEDWFTDDSADDPFKTDAEEEVDPRVPAAHHGGGPHKDVGGGGAASSSSSSKHPVPVGKPAAMKPADAEAFKFDEPLPEGWIGPMDDGSYFYKGERIGRMGYKHWGCVHCYMHKGCERYQRVGYIPTMGTFVLWLSIGMANRDQEGDSDDVRAARADEHLEELTMLVDAQRAAAA